MKFPERVYFTVEILDTSSLMSALVSSGMVLLIMLSILLWMVGTMSEVSTVRCSDCDPTPPTYMYLVDDFCVCMFTLEYLVRLIAVVPSRVELLQLSFVEALLVSDAGDASSTHRARGARKLFEFVRSPSNVCDLLTVLPHWAERLFQVSQLSVQWLRLLRILRVSRVFKLMRLFRLDLGRLSDVQSVLASVTAQAFPAAVMTFGLVFIALVVFSALIYVVERGDWYPAEQLSVYPSISGEHSEGRFVRCTSRRGRELGASGGGPAPGNHGCSYMVGRKFGALGTHRSEIDERGGASGALSYAAKPTLGAQAALARPPRGLDSRPLHGCFPCVPSCEYTP